MPPETWPRVVSIDTSGPFCAIGISREGHAAGDVHDMTRGQAEALFPLLEARLADAGWAWRDVQALGVSVGPGNFTGIRIGVSAARGLALSLGIPAYGVTNFELAALAEGLGLDGVAIALPAPRGQAYVQAFRQGAPVGAPRMIDPNDPPEGLLPRDTRLIAGCGAEALASRLGGTGRDMDFAPAPALLAQCAADRYRAREGAPDDTARPLYVRPADAAPPSDPPPVILP